ncbi:MAG TPA: helix-turn-helix transcriptional regulator [Pirellulales bacterium]
MNNATFQKTRGLIVRRLKYAREKLGLTQAELSSKLGFNDRQTVAAIEAGMRAISAQELIAAAHVLGVNLDYFADSFQLAGEGSFSWRANTAEPRALASFEEKAGGWVATYRCLGEQQRAKRLPLQPRLGLVVESSYEEAEEAGEAVCREWRLGGSPAEKLEAAIQKHLEAPVLWVDAPGSISGAAFRMQGLDAILINRNEPAGRRHFDLAHECFHLLTWEQMPPDHTELIDGPSSGSDVRNGLNSSQMHSLARSLCRGAYLIRIGWAAVGVTCMRG